jgi:hypothetical protein
MEMPTGRTTRSMAPSTRGDEQWAGQVSNRQVIPARSGGQHAARTAPRRTDSDPGERAAAYRIAVDATSSGRDRGRTCGIRLVRPALYH